MPKPAILDVARPDRGDPAMKMHRYVVGVGLLAVATAANGLAMRASAAQEMPPEILATQIRSQGFACEKPLSATRDLNLSKPDQAVWTLKCKDISYRVHLNPGMAARVQRLP